MANVPHRLARRWLGALLALALLTACAPPQVGAPNPGPTLNLLGGFPATLDPAQGSGGDATLYLQSIFSGLMRYNASGQLVPDLAEKWSISADRTVYTFTLRPNATFHNGTKVTAAAVVYSLNRACDPHTAPPFVADYLGVIQGAPERLAGKAASVSGVTALDPSTVRITLVHPDDAFLAKLTFPLTFVVDQQTVEAGGKVWWQHPNGSGPFRLTQWQPNSAAVLDRYPGYYGPAPRLAKVVLHNPSALGDASKAFQNGQLDMLPLPADPQDIGAFLDAKTNIPADLRSDLHVYDVAALQYLALDTAAPPFENQSVRQAVNLVLDKWSLVIGALGGDGWPANGILPPSVPGYRASFNPYPTNATLAKALLSRSPYAGQTLTITLASAERMANGQPGPVTSGVAALLHQALGWNVQWRYVSDAQITSALMQGKPPADMVLSGWQADYLDPQDFLSLLFHSGRATNSTHYHNPLVDQLLDRADQAASATQRRDLYAQAQSVIMRDAPIVPLYFTREFVLLSPHVASLPLLPDGSFDLRDARMN